jgi:septal ring factor EnvC (AmiA/AmiB activator)
MVRSAGARARAGARLRDDMDTASPKGPLRGSLRSALLALAALGLAATSLAVGVLAGRAAPATDVLDAQRSQVRELEAEVATIDARAGAAADAHAAATARAQELRDRIARTTAAIDQAEAARRDAVGRLAERLRAIYAAEPPSLAEVILTSGSLTEAVDAQRALESVGRSDAAVIDGLRTAQARLGALRAELVESRDEADAAVAASQARMQELDTLIADRRQALAAARERVEGTVRRRAAAAADARAERALLRRAADPSPAAPATPSAPAATTPAASSAPAPAPDPAPQAAPAPAGDVASHLARIAQCESGGNPRAVSASGQYRGKYQFDQGTWEAYGGTGDPAAAPEAEQDRVAAALYAARGAAPWPVCGYR